MKTWTNAMLALLALTFVPDYVGRSLDKQIVREAGQTYTVGPGRYVHRLPKVRSERTRCVRDTFMEYKDRRVWDCRSNQ